ncbi:hypothetical protein CBL_03509 [Carabus blaptoides fortunei]
MVLASDSIYLNAFIPFLFLNGRLLEGKKDIVLGAEEEANLRLCLSTPNCKTSAFNSGVALVVVDYTNRVLSLASEITTRTEKQIYKTNRRNNSNVRCNREAQHGTTSRRRRRANCTKTFVKRIVEARLPCINKRYNRREWPQILGLQNI